MTTSAALSMTPGSPDAVLAVVHAARAAEDAAARAVFVGAAEWAAIHEPLDPRDGAVHAFYGLPVPIAGAGCPLIDEFAVAEFAAAAGLTTDAGRRLLGAAVETVHRLPKLWTLVNLGRVPAWRARLVADKTIPLTAEAAEFVDKHVDAVAGKVGPIQLERLVLEAKRRHMPETLESEADPDTARDKRGVWLQTEQISYDGVVPLFGHLELPDALDLDDALSATAAQLKLAGSAESLDARRALALGELARNQLALTFDTPEAACDGTRPRPVTRPVTLYLHLAEASVTGIGGVGRCDNTRTPIDPQVIRAWCGNTRVAVKPVIDLNEHVAVTQYEVPDRIAERTRLRDVQCTFPWCTRPARTACDGDHAIPYAQGGSTCSCNIASLCRHHHRLKTHTAWRYKMPEPGVYLWTSPHGYVFLRDHTGTIDVTPPGLTPQPGCPPDSHGSGPPDLSTPDGVQQPHGP